MVDVREAINDVLEKIKQEYGYENGQTVVEAISTHGANYSSTLHIAKISEPEQKDLNLFIKTAIIGEEVRNMTPFDMYDTERFAYKVLLKAYKDIEEKHKVPIEHRMVTPKFYGSGEVYLKEVIVLEDLSASGYTTFDRFKCIDWEYASGSIKNLAKFHALSIALSEEYPNEFENVKEMKMDSAAMSIMDFLNPVMENVLKITKEENKDRLSKFITDVTGNLESGMYFKPIRRPFIAHGDYRPSNLMHKVKEDSSVDVISVDYQTLQKGNPIIDLMYFIFTGSDKKFREKYFKQSLDFYYTELSAALRRLDLNPDDIYPKDDFEYELQQILPYGLIMALFTLPLITVDAKDAPQLNDFSSMAVNPNELSTQRLNDVIDDYIEMGIL